MGEIVNLAEYRRNKELDEIEYLKAVLDDIIASMPDMEQEGYFIEDYLVYLMPQTNLDGYDPETDK
tara:strand:+ start:282 stop:479 length:198 start_codon:yes stop_codon:yes gene_type:complete